MAKKNEVTVDERWDRYIDASGVLSEIDENQGALKNGSPEEREKAEKWLRNTAYSAVPETRREGLGSADDLTDDEYKSNYNVVLVGNDQKARTNFKEILPNIGNIGKARKALEEIAGAAEIMDRVPQRDRDVVEKIASWKGLERLASKYDSGSALSKDDRKLLQGAGAEGFADDEVKQLKKKNKEAGEDYSDAFYDAVKTASQIGVMSGRVKAAELEPFIKSGLKNLTGKAREDYEKALGDDKNRIYEIVGSAVNNWANESPEEFDKVEQSIYRADQGKLYK